MTIDATQLNATTRLIGKCDAKMPLFVMMSD
jgi:hypothetical protein